MERSQIWLAPEEGAWNQVCCVAGIGWAALNPRTRLTSADDAGILVVPAVVLPPAQVEAIRQVSLQASTIHVVQKNGPGTVTKVAQDSGRDRRPAAHLPADHLGIGEIPIVVTHRAPGVAVQNLHPALAAAVPIRQPDVATCGSDPESKGVGEG